MNEREKLKNTLTHYSEISPNLPGDSKFQQDCVQRFESLLTSERSGYRDHLPGHFTGAALIVDPTGERVLLTHHRKLKKWLQLGGHADGDWDLSRVALKEGQEESGLNKLSFIPGNAHCPCKRSKNNSENLFHRCSTKRKEIIYHCNKRNKCN